MSLAVCIPLFNIVLAIVILFGIIKGRSRVWIKMVPALIFIDLFLFGHFFNPIWKGKLDLDKASHYNKGVEYLQSTGIDPHNYRILSIPSTPPLRTNTIELLDTLYCNSNSLYKIESINGFSGFVLKGYSELLGMDEAGMADFDWLLANNRVLSMLGVRYIFSNIHHPEYIQLAPHDENTEARKFRKWINLKPNTDYKIEIIAKTGNHSKGYIVLSVFGYSRKKEPLTIHSVIIGEEGPQVKEIVLDFHTDFLQKDEYYLEVLNRSSGGVIIEYLSIKEIKSGKDILFPATKTLAELSTHGENYIKKFQNNSITIFENKNVLPKQFLVSKFRLVKNLQEAVSLLRDNEIDIDLSKEVLLEADKIPGVLEEGESFVSSISYKSDEILASVTIHGNKILVMSEIYYPGWKVYIDGRKGEILKVNAILRGVFVPSGNHIIRMLYDPLSLKVGLIISGLAWIGVVVYLIIFKRARYGTD